MSSPTPQASAATTAPPQRRAENLALTLQEVFTVIERLRSNRQPVTDANVFRQQMRDVLKTADQDARNRGYTGDETALAIFAVVAFLDESILNLQLPVFREWPRQPLQEEMYGHHIAGEIFFQNLEKLLRGNDSQELADLLEVYQLCLLLGFAGRYSISGRNELRAIITAVGDKIQRIRKSTTELSPSWQLPLESVTFSSSDPWVKRLIVASALCAFLTVALFVLYKLTLGSGVSSLRAISGRS